MANADSTSAQDEDTILYDVVERHIAKITINRPERRNAIIVPDMHVLLSERIRTAEDDDDIKVIILTGAGDHFCAGDDVRRTPVESFGLKKGQRLPQSRRIRGASSNPAYKNTLFSDKTIIGALKGACLGHGAGIALTCDLLVASDDLKFARYQGRLGFAGYDLMLPLMLLKLGVNRGYEALMTGRSMSAAELKEIGFISSVVPRERLDDEALRYARAVALHSTDGLMLARQAKKLFFQLIGVGAFNEFNNIAHPLFTNLVWREDEFNLLKARDEYGPREGMRQMHKRWGDLGFD